MAKTSLKATFAICVIVAAAAVAYSSVVNSVTVNNTVNVQARGIGVYQNFECTQQLLTIVWGDCPRGTGKTVTVYVRAESGSALDINGFWNTTALPVGFTLSASIDGGALSWDENMALSMTRGIVYNATFSLTVAADAEAKAYNWFTNFRDEPPA